MRWQGDNGFGCGICEDMPFIWFQRWVNPAFYDQMMQACARGGLKAPRIVQEAPDRDTQLGLVQCRIGVAWLNRIHTLALSAQASRCCRSWT